MTREEKIQFIIKAVDIIEGVLVVSPHYDHWKDEHINAELERFLYLLDK